MKTPYLIILLFLLGACSHNVMNASIHKEQNRKLDDINIASYDMNEANVTDDPDLFFSLMDLNQQQKALIDFGRQYLGLSYNYGSTNPAEGFDCSGFTQYAYKTVLGKTLPRTAQQMSQVGIDVSAEELKAGDLVFFDTRGFPFSHCGDIYWRGEILPCQHQRKRHNYW